MHPAIEELVGFSGGVVARRPYPELHSAFDDAVRRGELVSALPGVYVLPARARDWRALVSAVHWWDERAVIVGEAAAALTFWPELTPRTIDIATQRRTGARPGFRFLRRDVPDALTLRRGGVCLADPALTALDLCAQLGGDVIDRALRSRTTTVTALQDALSATPYRHGNPERQRLLLDSRGNAWSAAERLAHRVLRAAGIHRWHANVELRFAGRKYFLDIAMDDCPLVIEIDGKGHLREDTFEHDRRRGNVLLLAGKHVMHFTWRMLTEEPGWVVDTTRAGMDLLSRGGPKIYR